MSTVRVFHLFINNWSECPVVIKHDAIYCKKYGTKICEINEFNNFIKTCKFPKFCNLVEIEETIIEENKIEENNEKGDKQL